MMIPVVRLDPLSQWDQTMLNELFANRLWPTGIEFTEVDSWPIALTSHDGVTNSPFRGLINRSGVDYADGIVLVIPGRYWNERTSEITEAISRYTWILAIRTGDEEDSFDIVTITHPNIRWWVQTPHSDKDYGDARLFGVGYTPHFTDLPAEPPDKDLDVFLAGQNTHTRRREAFAAMRRFPSTVLNRGYPSTVCHESLAFTQGMPPDEYTHHMLRAKIAPAPSGPVTPDTFRTYEALETHAIPLADDLCPGYHSEGYWRMLFPDAPFPVMFTDWGSLPGLVDKLLSEWPANANRVAAWWMRQKRAMAQWLREDLIALNAIPKEF